MNAVSNRRKGSKSADKALFALEQFAKSAGVSFDSFLAARALSESKQAIPGDDWHSWSRRLVEVGESLQLRVRGLESSIEDALVYLRQGTPIATCSPGPDGNLRWLLLGAIRRGKVKVLSAETHQADEWISLAQLRRRMNLADRHATCRWVVGQAALLCDSGVSNPASSDAPRNLPPLSRLLRLMKPEKKDLWVIVVFAVVVGVLALATPIAVEALVNTVAFGRYLQPIIVLALMLLVFLGFAAAMRALITFIVEILQRRLFIRVVEDLAYRFPRVRQESLDKSYGPELANRFFDVVTVQKTMSSLLLDGIAIVLQTVIGMAVLAFYHPYLLGFDVVLLASIAFIIFVLGRGAIQSAVKESKAKYAIGAWLEELVRHPTAFKLNGGSNFALERADQLAVDWIDKRRSHFKVVMRQILFALGLQAVAATTLLGLGGWLVLAGELTLGQLVAAELIVTIIVGSFAKLGKHMESFYDLLASVDKLGVLFDLPVEPYDKLFHLREGTPAHVTTHGISAHVGAGTLRGPLDLDVRAGEFVAIVGPSGAGKSLLIDVLAGVRQPSTGHVELDGVDLRELRPDSLRDHLAVARGVEVFHGTINENIHLGRPYISASDVRESLQLVGLHDELLKLPEGLNTMLQTGGSPLSENQAARLMLARAVVGRPRLLLVDGTLDRLSDETIDELLGNLTRSSATWTLMIATHRREVVRACRRTVNLGSDSSPSHEIAWNDS